MKFGKDHIAPPENIEQTNLYLLLFQDHRTFKIGISRVPVARTRSLRQTFGHFDDENSLVFTGVKNAQAIERELHERLNKFLKTGARFEKSTYDSGMTETYDIAGFDEALKLLHSLLGNSERSYLSLSQAKYGDKVFDAPTIDRLRNVISDDLDDHESCLSQIGTFNEFVQQNLSRLDNVQVYGDPPLALFPSREIESSHSDKLPLAGLGRSISFSGTIHSKDVMASIEEAINLMQRRAYVHTGAGRILFWVVDNHRISLEGNKLQVELFLNPGLVTSLKRIWPGRYAPKSAQKLESLLAKLFRPAT